MSEITRLSFHSKSSIRHKSAKSGNREIRINTSLDTFLSCDTFPRSSNGTEPHRLGLLTNFDSNRKSRYRRGRESDTRSRMNDDETHALSGVQGLREDPDRCDGATKQPTGKINDLIWVLRRLQTAHGAGLFVEEMSPGLASCAKICLR